MNFFFKQARVRLEEKSIRTLKKRQVSERPWYDVSDDESDLLSPERLTQLKTPHSSSTSSTANNSEEEIDVWNVISKSSHLKTEKTNKSILKTKHLLLVWEIASKELIQYFIIFSQNLTKS